MKSATHIREAFLAFFEAQGHSRVPSSSLIPQNDPTLLFTNAGMVQFKDVFVGKEKRDYARAASSQKCVRAGGKHNDLENVGFTARHHTFFEMLGNFSFGDYFKEDACKLAWDFLLKELGLPLERLTFTVFREDDEAEKIWKKIGAKSNTIYRCDEKDNFWAMGDVGPCGPCSEIHYDLGEGAVTCPNPSKCDVTCDCGRHLEVWNLVFMQYETHPDGSRTNLPRPSIDTGMGLERIASVVQGVTTNYDTDLFRPLMSAISELSGVPYGKARDTDVSIRVIADHIRATSFLISDGVMPSNEGRGYVLRRIMRRAIRHGKNLNLDRPFMFELYGAVQSLMGSAYPDLSRNESFVTSVIKNEESKFQETLENGLGLLNQSMERLKTGGPLPADVAFKLYDTYGFPLDLTQVIAKEKNLDVDTAGFEALMEKQREQSRKHWKGSGESGIAEGLKELQAEGLGTEFLGYSQLSAKATVRAILSAGKRTASANKGDIEILCEQTPFYGESGGQIGDRGTLEGENFKGAVTDCIKPFPELFVHKCTILSGSVKEGDTVELRVDPRHRQKVRVNHSLTHVLHATLFEQLGDHVKQAGSLVTPDYLRFDFSHFEAIPKDKLRKIEEIANRRIRENHPIKTELLDKESAVKRGAKAFFGDKYGDVVRVVSISDYSQELCGGTHAAHTGEAGLLRITSEGSVASGVRRIVAVTGEAALQSVYENEQRLNEVAHLFQASPKELALKIQKQFAYLETLEKKAKSVAQSESGQHVDTLVESAKTIADVTVVAAHIEDGVENLGGLRDLSDRIRDRIQSGIVALAFAQDGKATMVVSLTKDLTARLRAGDLVKAIAGELGGRGGGKPDFAQLGFDPLKVTQAVPTLLDAIRAQLGASA